MSIVVPLLNPARTVTALDMIKRAMRLLGVASISEQIAAEEAADGLNALNAMIDSWANERLMTYTPSLDSIPLVPGTASYTIGPNGSFVTTRPESIDESSYLLYDGISYPLKVATLAQYNAETLKTLQSNLPYLLLYTPDFPDGKITLFPVPTAAMTLQLWSWKRLTGFQNLIIENALPPGYENAIVYNLAEALAPEYEVPVPPTVARKAVTSKKALKRVNYEPLMLSFASAVLPSGGRFNIYSGQ